MTSKITSYLIEKALVRDSRDLKAPSTSVDLNTSFSVVGPDQLRSWVEELSYPRDYEMQPEANRAARDWLYDEFQKMGFVTSLQGEFDNVVATLPGAVGKPVVVVGAHYDSVPNTPGADDNGSAVSVMLAVAKTFIEHHENRNICFVGFNLEEHWDAAGSRDFAEQVKLGRLPKVVEAHILEMVGYCSHEPGSQRTPDGFPVRLPNVGDFLGIVAKGSSRGMAKAALQSAAIHKSDSLPVLSLTIPFGIERIKSLGLLDTIRSDHQSFWTQHIPSVMWTDTANFRNSNYHQPSDTPDTLDYRFMNDVKDVLIATLLKRTKAS